MTFLWIERWSFFFLILKEERQIIIFFPGSKKEWVRKFTVCLYSVLSHGMCPRERGCKSGKNHQNMCDWLFPAWHLVVSWENCSFWPTRDPWENHKKGKCISGVTVLCIHRSPQFFVLFFFFKNYNRSLRTDPRKLKSRLWWLSLERVWASTTLHRDIQQ